MYRYATPINLLYDVSYNGVSSIGCPSARTVATPLPCTRTWFLRFRAKFPGGCRVCRLAGTVLPPYLLVTGDFSLVHFMTPHGHFRIVPRPKTAKLCRVSDNHFKVIAARFIPVLFMFNRGYVATRQHNTFWCHRVLLGLQWCVGRYLP